MRFIIGLLICAFWSCQSPTVNSDTPLTDAEIKTAKALVQGAFDDL